ncbi:MAG: carboxy-S-adenosyl-L-methionine synthase CmoA [Pseudomonadota bacterium]|nr:carboxy-S-adenosyl-L-methionine synthase CmoA [Pseudomonadota bacterium]
MSKDDIFKSTDAGPGTFEFNDSVAEVFTDMLRRSVPGYEASLEAIAILARRYGRAGTRCYDLGCSLGASTLAMRRNIVEPDCEIVAVDLSPAMIDRCRKIVDADDTDLPVSIRVEDVRDVAIEHASLVVLNYTLQFVPVNDRSRLVRRIYDGLIDGGVLILSEKIVDEDPAIEGLLVELHHEFKSANAYSDLEIARKRMALEEVLIPESTAAHLERLADAGFNHRSVWLKHFNFVSILAIR